MIKSLINLQLLDTICGQVDRNSSNLFFTYEERDGKRILKGVTGIDSDMAFGTTAYAALEERRDGFLQLKPIEQNGTCTLPYLDQTVCAHILSLDKNMVFFVMSDLLNQKELDALWGRIEGVQNLLLKNIDRMTDDTWPCIPILSRSGISTTEPTLTKFQICWHKIRHLQLQYLLKKYLKNAEKRIDILLRICYNPIIVIITIIS